MNRATSFALVRLVLGFIGLSAVVTEIATLIERSTFLWYNFFSYFTIQSNIAVGLFLIGYAAFGRSEQARSSRTVQGMRGAITLYITMTGVIFTLLLAGLPGAILTAVPWDNIVLHYIMPIVMIIDWFVDRPAVRLELRACLVWLIYPVCYVGWAIIRGLIDTWYPYPFLDAGLRGYPTVVVTIMIMSVAVAAAGWLLATIPSRLPTRRIVDHDPRQSRMSR